MPTATITYETAQFLHSLLGNDIGNLKALGEAFDVRVTSRDGWIRLEGTGENIESSRQCSSSWRKSGDRVAKSHPPCFNWWWTASSIPSYRLPPTKSWNYGLLGSSRKPPVLAKTRGQMDYIEAMRKHEVVFGTGPAGTGKTFLAMAHALQMLRDKTVHRIVLARPAVEAGEALGFLPGDLKEKILPYLRPLYDALYDILESDEAERLIERGIVEIAPLAYMRGRTLKNSFVILDEAQNTTTEQMFMFLTRLGEHSRCVVTGDPSQVDLKRGTRSGLAEALIALKCVQGIHFVKFEPQDVVRLPVVRRIIEAYRIHRESGD